MPDSGTRESRLKTQHEAWEAQRDPLRAWSHPRSPTTTLYSQLGPTGKYAQDFRLETLSQWLACTLTHRRQQGSITAMVSEGERIPASPGRANFYHEWTSRTRSLRVSHPHNKSCCILFSLPNQKPHFWINIVTGPLTLEYKKHT